MMSALAGIAGGKGTPSRTGARGDAAKPLRLIYMDANGKFVFDPLAKKTLEQVRGPVGVVAVCGKARQGKSFVLNQLLGRSSGFEVAPTHRPCTKGLWMWSAPIKVELGDSGEHYHMILLDTEGIDATDQTGTYSTQIFSLAVLLSSTFVYNQMGPIDEAALDKLSLITEMVKNIKMKSSSQSKSSNSAAELSQFSPFFLWLLRDFYLELREDGVEITPRDYLEGSLRPAPGSGKAVASKNEVRDLIRSLFPDRDCFALVRPVTDERDLQRLSSFPMNKLRPEFVSGLKNLTDVIFNRTQPKQMDGMMLTGQSLAGMAQCFIDAINGGAVPVISTSWESVADAQCRKALEMATEAYWAGLDRTVALEEEALNAAHKKAVDAARIVFGEEAVRGGSIRLKFEQLLANSLGKLFEDHKRSLYRDADLRCTAILDDLRKEMVERCMDPKTSLTDFFKILDDLLMRYERDMCGPAKWQYLVRFMYQSVYGPAREVMQRNMDAVQRKLDASLADFAALRASNTVMEDQCNSLKKMVESTQRDLDECRRKLGKTLDESLLAAKDARKKEDGLRLEQATALASKDRDIKELQGKMEAMAKQSAELGEKWKDKNMAVSLLERDLKAVTDDAKRVREVAEECRLKATSLERELREAKMAEAAAVKERDRATERADAAARARKVAEEEVKHRMELERESRGMVISANKEKEEGRVREAKMEGELQETRRVLAANEQTLAEKETELEEQRKERERAVKVLEEKLAKESTEKMKATHMLEGLESQLALMKQHHDYLKQNHEKGKEQETALEKKVQELQRQVLSTASQSAAMSKERDGVKAVLEKTEAMLEQARKRAEKDELIIREKEMALLEEERERKKGVQEAQEMLKKEQLRREEVERFAARSREEAQEMLKKEQLRREEVERLAARSREEAQEMLKKEQLRREEVERLAARSREEMAALQRQVIVLQKEIVQINRGKGELESLVQEIERVKGSEVETAALKYSEALKEVASLRQQLKETMENSEVDVKRALCSVTNVEEESRIVKARMEEAVFQARSHAEAAERLASERAKERDALEIELQRVREEMGRTKEQGVARLKVQTFETEQAVSQAKSRADEAERLASQRGKQLEALETEMKRVREEVERLKEREVVELKIRTEEAEEKARVLKSLKDAAEGQVEEIAKRLKLRDDELQAVQKELKVARGREHELDRRLQAHLMEAAAAAATVIPSSVGSKRRRTAVALDDEESMEMDGLAQNGAGALVKTRHVDQMEACSGGGEMVEGFSGTAEDAMLVLPQQQREYEKWTVLKLKQELTKHKLGAELLKLVRPTKKDILALYERRVVRARDDGNS